ncbi:MAG: Usg family protein [Alphaproteobacteria bacterium]|nr:Usg family protein [Alphaproteobacteria bacterium]
MAKRLYTPNDYKLMTAQILYHLPDYPSLLQTYIWQDLDLAPDFPTLMKFLDFWDKNLEGRMHSVTVTHAEPVLEPKMRFYQQSLEIH